MITLDSLRFLQSAAGATLLDELQSADPQTLSDANTLKLLTALRKRYSPDNAAAALETVRVRIRARDKFPAEVADHLFSTREALEQATPWVVGKHVHRRFLSGFDTIADLGTLPKIFARRGYKSSDVDRIMSGNFINFLRNAWR